MFIDSDIKWFPYDIYKLILSDKDVIGGAYPLKKYNFERLNEENVISTWKDKRTSQSENDRRRTVS
jgi:hypothetical protein